MSTPITLATARSPADVPAEPVPPRDAATADTPSVPPLADHQQWIGEAFSRYERPLLAYAYRMLGGDFSAAQDAVQETFLRLCREDRDRVADRLAAWLFAVCRSRVIDMKRARAAIPDTDVVAATTAVADDSADAVEDREQADRLARQIDRLTPRRQEVLRLRLQAGLSYREIAEVTGLSVSNVGFHLHAAVRSLRDSMLSS